MESGSQPQPVFEPLPMRRRTMEKVPSNLYRIVSPSGDTRHLQAITAYEAFLMSGFPKALKIERMINIKEEIVGNNKFIDHMAFKFKVPIADINTEKEDPSFTIKQRTIVSANELDSLIKSIQELAIEKDNSNKLVATQVPMLQTFDEGLMPGPTGLDVHGDGFDEIIPSNNLARPHGVKPVEIADMPLIAMPEDEPEPAAEASEPEQPASAIMEPQRELSAAEIEGLLSGNLPGAS